MTGQHRNPDPPPRARWLHWAIGAGIAVLVPASLVAMRVGDALSVTAGEPAEPTTAATRTTAPVASFTPPVFAPPNIPTIGAEGHWTPPADATPARTTVASTPERRSAPRTVAPRYTETPKPTPEVVAPTLAAATPPAPAPAPVEPEPQQQDGITDGLLALVNTARTEAGCLPLTEDPGMTAFAAVWSAEQAAAGHMSHSSGPYAENVAYGYETAAAVFEGWMTSPGHRNNVLECSWTRHGIGAATGSDGRIYWTEVFST